MKNGAVQYSEDEDSEARQGREPSADTMVIMRQLQAVQADVKLIKGQVASIVAEENNARLRQQNNPDTTNARIDALLDRWEDEQVREQEAAQAFETLQSYVNRGQHRMLAKRGVTDLVNELVEAPDGRIAQTQSQERGGCCDCCSCPLF